ncbi:MAG: Inositol 2-dehydrogenase [candidate division BRC1 bacterium ADurb.BinA364]|nr:MAG: Inositol 2-dehydrogenase [candidate division BRC1 bacterium ADurb.BinA364]
MNGHFDRLNIAIIGCGGRGRVNTSAVQSETIAAVCDVDERELAISARQFPKARAYADWRRCIEQKDLDAVVCSTTDFTHAFVSTWALERGLHVYCENPLGVVVEEARAARAAYLSARGKLATQMGMRRASNANLARVAAMIRGGAIGAPREVHLWRAGTSRGNSYYPAAGPPPAALRWDLWLGPSPEHPYNPEYLAQRPCRCLSWSRHWDFGAGRIGGMGSSLMDIAWRALELDAPLSCACQGEAASPDSVPDWIAAEWKHPANAWRPAIAVHWHDGGRRPAPPSDVFDFERMPAGALFRGDAGYVVCDFEQCCWAPNGKAANWRGPAAAMRGADGPGLHDEWIDACKTGAPTSVNFDYAGRLAEHNLLALVAFRAGRTIDYDAEASRCPNCPEAERYLRKPYREGWALKG